MAVKQIVPGVYEVSLGFVNVFLIEADGLTLVDTGIAGSAEKILQAVREIGKQPADIRHILVTHCHADHTGSLHALKQATGAPAYMHPADAAMVREGKAARPMTPATLLGSLMVRLIAARGAATVTPADIEHEVHGGDELPMAGGIRAVHVPGHSAGQLAFLWPHQGGLLFAADAAANMMGRLGPSIVYEDPEEGQRSLANLAALDFETACFGHGRAIVGAAADRFRQKWGASVERRSARV